MNAEKPSVAHNVDHNEIAKFEAVASRWWDLEGEFKPLHRINPLRLGYIAERPAACLAKKYLMSAAAAASWRKAWRGRRSGDRSGYGLRTATGGETHALESGIQVEYPGNR
jgi:2-polyprenyl-6-hydroxyphenyl methylase/3-demethylubiquinone-9 3-methyltransferase